MEDPKEPLLHCDALSGLSEDEFAVMPEKKIVPIHKRPMYWVITFCVHFGIISFVLLLLRKYDGKALFSDTPTTAVKASDVLGDFKFPINNQQRFKIESVPHGAWGDATYFGGPSPESDEAWDALIQPRNFQIPVDHASKYNITDSILIEPRDSYASILGVFHNLHCLRRFRQTLYSGYYYPNWTEEDFDHDRHHTLHCLETIRSSLVCNADLNPHPYYWSGRYYHDITVSAEVTRQCVDWSSLQQTLKANVFHDADLIYDSGPQY